jgi:hypothetical protein
MIKKNLLSSIVALTIFGAGTELIYAQAPPKQQPTPQIQFEITPDETYKTPWIELKPIPIFKEGKSEWRMTVKSMVFWDWVELKVISRSPNWKYVEEENAIVLADGEKISIGTTKRKPTPLNDGSVQEVVSIFISEKVFPTLTKASRIDIWIGADKHQLPGIAVEGIPGICEPSSQKGNY